jgi:hypothetical protein
MKTSHYNTEGDYAEGSEEVAATWTEANFVLVLRWNYTRFAAFLDVVTFESEEEAEKFLERFTHMASIEYKSWE